MIEIIQERLNSYAESASSDHALKEVIQEIALFGLWRAGFFKVGAFQGGTSLRILHRLPRFSEDMDFILLQPDRNFVWDHYVSQLQTTLNEFGVAVDVSSKPSDGKAIKRADIKNTSLVNQLDLSFFGDMPGRTLRIKLEIDVNPPAASDFDHSFLDFPSDFEVCHQDLASNFALKIHALLCRGFVKGRDWFDFSWYVRRRCRPNLPHLQAAIEQSGPWAGQGETVDVNWLDQTLKLRIAEIDWSHAQRDVERFLDTTERESLQLWGERFFSAKVDSLIGLFAGD